MGSRVQVELPGAEGSTSGRVVRAVDGVVGIAFDEQRGNLERVDRALRQITTFTAAA